VPSQSFADELPLRDAVRSAKSMVKVSIDDFVEYRACNRFGRAIAEFDRTRLRVRLDVHHAAFYSIGGCVGPAFALDSHSTASLQSISPGLLFISRTFGGRRDSKQRRIGEGQIREHIPTQ
jgi:hypothetical protein